jgi:hypothetical protein
MKQPNRGNLVALISLQNIKILKDKEKKKKKKEGSLTFARRHIFQLVLSRHHYQP